MPAVHTEDWSLLLVPVTRLQEHRLGNPCTDTPRTVHLCSDTQHRHCSCPG